MKKEEIKTSYYAETHFGGDQIVSEELDNKLPGQVSELIVELRLVHSEKEKDHQQSTSLNKQPPHTILFTNRVWSLQKNLWFDRIW